MSFNEKVALVTGGASGIGLGIVHNLLQNGIKGIGIVDILDEGLKTLEHELQDKYPGKILLIKADITKSQELEGAFEKTIHKFKNLDIVVNNAGILNEVHWEKTIALNLEAVIRGTYLAKDKYLPRYKFGEEGIILNTASVAGLTSFYYTPVYSATKHGVVGLGKSLGAQEIVNPCKIKLITLCPGAVDTPLLRKNALPLQPANFQRDAKKALDIAVSPDFIGKSVIKLLEEAEHGSVWIIDNEDSPCKLRFPDLPELRKM